MPRNLQGQTVVLVTSPLIFSSSGCQHCINTRTPYRSSTHVNRDLQQTSDNFAIEFYTKKFDKIPLQSFTEKLFEASEQNVNARFSINQHSASATSASGKSKQEYIPAVCQGRLAVCSIGVQGAEHKEHRCASSLYERCGSSLARGWSHTSLYNASTHSTAPSHTLTLSTTCTVQEVHFIHASLLLKYCLIY
jgi:hypothetical protein